MTSPLKLFRFDGMFRYCVWPMGTLTGVKPHLFLEINFGVVAYGAPLVSMIAPENCTL